MSTPVDTTSASPYGTLPPTSTPALRKPISLPRLLEMLKSLLGHMSQKDLKTFIELLEKARDNKKPDRS